MTVSKYLDILKLNYLKRKVALKSPLIKKQQQIKNKTIDAV